MGTFPVLTNEVIKRFDTPGPRYTSYPTLPEWTSSFDRAAYARKLEEAGRNAGAPLSLYVHIPFCKTRCTFCGCNVVIAKDRGRADEYIEHVLREMDLVLARLGERRRLSQVHWGGGTPTFLDEAQIDRLFGELTRRFEPLESAEIALEIHPSVTSRSQLTLLRALGFNRLSMGVQDFDPEVQRAIGRHQTLDETRDLLDHARALGFTGVNFDLIYGLPSQTPSTWSRTLEKVLAMRPDRIAVYSFAFVPEVKPHQRRLPIASLPSGREKIALFGEAYDTFVGAGYASIGMDHFALPDDELARARNERRLGRNFQGYTVKSATDVVAFGVTAISDLGGAYAQNVAALPRYYEAISAGRLATDRGLSLSDEDKKRRRVITDLMCNSWVDLGPDGMRDFALELQELRDLEKSGLVTVRENEIELTSLGRIFVRNVAMVFDERLRTAPRRHTFSRTV